MKRTRILAVVIGATLVAAAGGGLAYANLNGGTAVSAATAATSDLAVTVSATGTVTETSRGVYAPSAGRIAEVKVADGDVVKAGQTLVQVDRGPLRLAVAQARANLATATAQAKAAATGAPTGSESRAAAQAVTAARSAASTAARNYHDYLVDYRKASAAERDAMRSTLRTLRTADVQAQANLTLAKANRDRLALTAEVGSATKAARLAVEAARSALDQARDNLDHAALTAPIAGVVSVPDTVQSGAAVSPGVAVVTVSDPSAVAFTASVDQADVSGIKAGQTAKISLDAFTSTTFAGKVLSRAASATTTTTGGVAFNTRISLTVGKQQPLAGMGGSVEITVQNLSQVLTVPAAAVLTDGSSHHVFVIDTGGHARKATVGIGAQTDAAIQITSGLQAGDRVVTTGASGLQDGAAVKVG